MELSQCSRKLSQVLQNESFKKFTSLCKQRLILTILMEKNIFQKWVFFLLKASKFTKIEIFQNFFKKYRKMRIIEVIQKNYHNCWKIKRFKKITYSCKKPMIFTIFWEKNIFQNWVFFFFLNLKKFREIMMFQKKFNLFYKT